MVAVRRANLARNLLFASVAAVLAFAAERPARGSEPIVDDAVLAQVPARRSPEQRKLEALRQRAATHELPAQLQLARAYIEASRRDGDPRYLGAAEGVLLSLPPLPPVRVLRATVLQSRHEFDAALVELEHALAEQPDDQARLTQATVLTVLGEYTRARESCRALPPSIYEVACEAQLDALTGRHDKARAALEHALAGASFEQGWLRSLLGEQAYWTGDLQRAERELRAALVLDEGDRYSRALLADLLLDTGRLAEVPALATTHGDDAMMLRLALAELAAGEEGEAVARVEAAFADSRARGDAVHRREEARFWLARGQKERALACARDAWRAQREPWDARVLLEAASSKEQAAPALAWLAATQFAAPGLRSLAARLETP